jgi:hypothetical protein
MKILPNLKKYTVPFILGSFTALTVDSLISSKKKSLPLQQMQPLAKENKEQILDEAVKKQEICIKDIQSLSNTNDPNIVKSDLSELFNNFIDNYREFLSTLSSEQMVIVFNIIGYITLLFTLTSITNILIGDQLIKFLKLEIKFPKLANYIKFKQILNKHFLRFYIVLFYILLLLLISINIYMFSLEYFL